tara:strand:- start:12962 stop:13591 length:630 start_codon:yes stop_codon:yes gene_type:complete
METENEFEYVEPSNVGEYYLKHVEAMKPIKSQPEGKSFAIQREGYSLALLREIADLANVGKKAVVVIEWPEVFEVQRLPDGSNTKLFYRYSTGDKKDRVEHSEIGDSVSDIKSIVAQYIESNFEDCLKYDKKLNAEAKIENVISYSYIQRRSASLASFRKAPEGSTARLKAAIDALVEIDFLNAVPDNVAAGTFETTGKLYQIVGNQGE